MVWEVRVWVREGRSISGRRVVLGGLSDKMLNFKEGEGFEWYLFGKLVRFFVI